MPDNIWDLEKKIQNGTLIEFYKKWKKKKILFFVHSLRHGGAERIVLELNQYVKKSNFDTKVLTWINENQYRGNKKYGKIEIKYLLKTADYNWIFSLFKSLKKLNLLLKKENPDLIHVNSINAFFLILLTNFKKKLFY